MFKNIRKDIINIVTYNIVIKYSFLYTSTRIYFTATSSSSIIYIR